MGSGYCNPNTESNVLTKQLLPVKHSIPLGVMWWLTVYNVWSLVGRNIFHYYVITYAF